MFKKQITKHATIALRGSVAQEQERNKAKCAAWGIQPPPPKEAPKVKTVSKKREFTAEGKEPSTWVI